MEYIEKLLTADVATLLAVALVLFVAIPILVMFKFGDAIEARIRGGKATASSESQRSLISREWVLEMTKLAKKVNEHEQSIGRITRHLGDLEDVVRGQREKSELLRNDVTRLNETVEGLCERVDEGRRESREDLQAIRESIQDLARGQRS